MINYSLDPGAFPPTRAHVTDAGIDLRTPSELWINPGKAATVDTGVRIEVPDGWSGMVKAKSGLNVKQDVTVTGVVDAGYSGSIVLRLRNLGEQTVSFKAGDKVAQLVIVPCHLGQLRRVDAIASGERGANGFGSTGR